MSKPQSSRLTPPGELLTEMVVSPSENLFVEATGAPTNKRANLLSFQSFGIHSTNTAAILPKDKSAHNFHSFNPQVAQETKAETVKPTAALNLTFDKKLAETDESNQEQKFGKSLIIICLLVALLFFTGFAFAATYFFEEKTFAPDLRETTFLSQSKVVRLTTAFSRYSFPPALISLNLSYLNYKKVCK